jgi:hypothetical protein
MNYLTRYRVLRGYAKSLGIRVPWYYGNARALQHLYNARLRQLNTVFTNRILDFRSQS